jgi:transposase-like protein
MHISKEGDSHLRRLMVQGAHYILGAFGEDCDLRRWGLKLAERGGKNAKKRAVIAVARKLAILLHKLWVRAVDSTGQTIDFLLSAKRDAAAAKRFFEKVFSSPANPIPRVINVDKNAAYPAAVDALKAEGTLPRRVRLRQCKYLNNVIEQDHRTVKKRTWLAKGYGSFQSAWRTLEGIETMNMIRKGRVRRVAKGNVVAEAQFIVMLFAIAA